MSWSFLDFTGLSHFFGKLPEKLVTTDTTQTISGTKSFSSTILGSVSGSAASAAKDGVGNVIADTYETKTDAATHLSKSDAAGTYLSKADATSGYVQTGAVDQTVAGTKTFSKPIVGSVTGSSGSCTGNAATATKATQDSVGQQINTTYIKGLAVSGRTITYTKGDGSTGTITTQDTNTTYASMSASEATTGTATAARTISAKVLHDKINSNLSAYATKTELNNGLTTKANNSEVVHKSGNETITGTKTFNDSVHANGFHSTTTNAFMAQRGEYTLVLRNDGSDTYLLMSDKGGVPGTWSDARPLIIHNSTGVCNINGNAATATKLASKRTIALSGAATGTATGFDGSGNITIPVTALSGSAITSAITIYDLVPDGAANHRNFYRGRDITAAFDAGTVSANIANGTFKDIFPGDYIRKQITVPRILKADGTTEYIAQTTYTVNFIIADLDIWLNRGDPATTAHHVAIVPKFVVFNSCMNETNTTEGGYLGSFMNTNVMPAFTTGLQNAFGSAHILQFSVWDTKAVNNELRSSGIVNFTGATYWGGHSKASHYCHLMTETMVYGAPITASCAADELMGGVQFAAFRLNNSLVYNHQNYWLGDVVSSAGFAFVAGYGVAYAGSASSVFGVRPFALLR